MNPSGMRRGLVVLIAALAVLVGVMSGASTSTGTRTASGARPNSALAAAPVPAPVRAPVSGPVARTVALLKALKAHRYAEACGLYHPVFWSRTGFASQSCAAVLRQTFPRREPVAYRVEFGGQASARSAIVVVSMVLGNHAALCERLWARSRWCPRASVFRFSLTLAKLFADWRLHKIVKPRDRWYVYEVGWI